MTLGGLPQLNPAQIVHKGPLIDFDAPYNRAHLTSVKNLAAL